MERDDRRPWGLIKDERGGEAATCKEILQVQNEECGKQINELVTKER